MNYIWQILNITDDCALFQFNNIIHNPWLMSIFASIIIGLTGIIPIFIIANDVFICPNDESSQKLIRNLLSFAVGGLLGDVFLHMLPEVWNKIHKSQISRQKTNTIFGVWIIFGIFTFAIIEILFKKRGKNNTNESLNSQNENLFNSCPIQQNKCNNANAQNIDVTGYLSLFANGIDNFSHGLAVGASFTAGIKIGVLTTFSIIIHECPHEFGDFAILIKSGFTKRDAAKAQLCIASITILGAIVALFADSFGKECIDTNWLLLFTSGGFLNIALVTIVPDLLEECDKWESFKQTISVGIGIGVMLVFKCFI